MTLTLGIPLERLKDAFAADELIIPAIWNEPIRRGCLYQCDSRLVLYQIALEGPDNTYLSRPKYTTSTPISDSGIGPTVHLNRNTNIITTNSIVITLVSAVVSEGVVMGLGDPKKVVSRMSLILATRDFKGKSGILSHRFNTGR